MQVRPDTCQANLLPALCTFIIFKRSLLFTVCLPSSLPLYVRRSSALYFHCTFLRTLFPLYVPPHFISTVRSSALYFHCTFLRTLFPLYVPPHFISTVRSSALYFHCTFLRTLFPLYVPPHFISTVRSSALYLQSSVSL